MKWLSERHLVGVPHHLRAKKARPLLLAGAAVVFAGLSLVAGAAAGSASSANAGPVIEFWNGTSWTQQPSPNPDGSGMLSTVTAVSATDVWALGAYGGEMQPYGGYYALAEHWDGSSWQQVAMPTPAGATQVNLYRAAASSATDMWAVGSWAGRAGHGWKALIEHWNGSSWTILPNPLKHVTAQLYGVAAPSPANAWAVGYSGNRTLILHWNGKVWKQVAIPHPGRNSLLTGIAAVSPRSVWAVGSYLPRVPNGHRSSYRTLALHWNGKAWKQVASPTPGASGGLSAVEAVGRNNVWAVGGYHHGSGHRLLTEHWNGHSWQVVPARSGYGNATYQGLNSLAVLSDDDIWAVGFYSTYPGNGLTLSTHWDGQGWLLVPSPNPAPSTPPHLSVRFSAVAAASPTAVWAVGSYYPGG